MNYIFKMIEFPYAVAEISWAIFTSILKTMIGDD